MANTIGAAELRFNALLGEMYAGPALEVSPDSGYINLLKLKRRFFGDGRLEKAVAGAIDGTLSDVCGKDDAEKVLGDSYREELFDKLYTFFSCYLSPSGAVYYCHTPPAQKFYGRIYAPDSDVALFYKTGGLHYVKSDTMVRSMSVPLYGDNPAEPRVRFDFDAVGLPEKIGNLRTDLSFALDSRRGKRNGGAIPIKVSRALKKSERSDGDNGGGKNGDAAAKEIAKAAQERGFGVVAAADVKRAMVIFGRQAEVDFFIHRDAGGFLRDQFTAFLLHYAIFGRKTVFSKLRFAQLRLLEAVGEAVIACVAQFEDELKRVWEKPKFVRGLNFVVTLDKITKPVRKKIAGHKGLTAQIREWEELRLDRRNITPQEVIAAYGENARLPIEPALFDGMESEINACRKGRAGITLGMIPRPTREKMAALKKETKAQIAKWDAAGANRVSLTKEMVAAPDGQNAYLPVDTKHFKSLERDILACLGDDLDAALDGELVHSENWQAINTLRHKYAGRVKCIHIDPPYNAKHSEVEYVNDYKHSTWLTMMGGRIDLSLGLLADDGIFLCHIDENEHERLHLLFDSDQIQDAGTIVWDKRNPMGGRGGVALQHEYVLCRVKQQLDLTRKRINAPAILKKARGLMKKHKNATAEMRGEFAEWMRQQNSFSETDKSFYHINDDGRVFASVHMGAPEQRTDSKFFKPLRHPDTKKPCPVPENGWSMTPEFIKGLLAAGDVVFGKDETTQPRQKYYLEDRMREPMSSIIPFGKKGKGVMDNLGLNFPFCHHPELYEMLLSMFEMKSGEVVVDFFGGSGTTADAVINLNRKDNGGRKYLLVEMGAHFHEVLLPRIKKRIYSAQWKAGSPSPAEGVSHCLKYYSLESYEDALHRARYCAKAPEQLEIAMDEGVTTYPFLCDPQMTDAVELDGRHLSLRLSGLYRDIDLAETLSQATGWRVARRGADKTILRDAGGEDHEFRADPKKMSDDEKSGIIDILRRYLWWGEAGK